ncbi:hypothetical protein BH11MYX4_BH11MYX4_64560 [soil metagenome]
MRRAALLLSVAASAGCAPATLEAAYVPNPVLLGPVDRVGGHRGAGKTLQPVNAEVNDFVSVSTSTQQVGSTTYTTRSTTIIQNGGGQVTAAVLDGTQGRPERDVRIDGVPAGAWTFFAGGSAMTNRWVGLEGRIVEVRSDR